MLKPARASVGRFAALSILKFRCCGLSVSIPGRGEVLYRKLAIKKGQNFFHPFSILLFY